ncbi:MAG TPA: leucyl aminopeptidase family protein [Alphaproteobacteria bacterium]|nr:leucyl aminopeptidase family protein [Alphaproteobacteria bacterium]
MSAFATKTAKAIPITPVFAGDLKAWLAKQPARLKAWATASGFDAAAGSVSLVTGPDGGLERVLLGLGKAAKAASHMNALAGGAPTEGKLWRYAALSAKLPAGAYAIDAKLKPAEATAAALGWALGAYQYGRYKSAKPYAAKLIWPAGADRAYVERAAAAHALVRDLVNTPASDMGPEELASAARAVAKETGAKIRIVVGDDLLKQNYPAIHAVGRASTRAPRLIDITWGKANAPKVTLIGKGVCFDTGGLDLKPSSGMILMKKDMAGAAQALALGRLIMQAKLNVRLRVLLPTVENSVSGNAMRPSDILHTRKGITVEVGNTDAEGRLILCDAIADAVAEKPEVMLDFATLTGAARVALGPELPALFCNDGGLLNELMGAAATEEDFVWPLPLWQGYRPLLASKVADINNISAGPFAGAVTAALFLQEFVPGDIPWAHLDFIGWNGSSKPGRPEGGEAQGLRAVFALLQKRYA